MTHYDHDLVQRPNSEPPPSPAPAEPEPFEGDAYQMLGTLLARTTQMQQQLGEKPSRSTPHGTGILGQIHDIRKTLGDSPDEATGGKGSGLRGEVAALVRAKREQTRTLVKSSAAVGGAIFAIVELLQQLVKLLH